MIFLSKNQTVSLSKSDTMIHSLRVGLGWKSAPVQTPSPVSFIDRIVQLSHPTAPIDLDASIVMLHSHLTIEDIVYYRKCMSSCRSILHRGDDRHGSTGNDDNEIIHINLQSMPENIAYIAININSFTRQTFDQIDSAYCHAYDGSAPDPFFSYDLTSKVPHTGLVAAIISKNDQWAFSALGVPCDFQTVRDSYHTIVDSIKTLHS